MGIYLSVLQLFVTLLIAPIAIAALLPVFISALLAGVVGGCISGIFLIPIFFLKAVSPFSSWALDKLVLVQRRRVETEKAYEKKLPCLAFLGWPFEKVLVLSLIIFEWFAKVELRYYRKAIPDTYIRPSLLLFIVHWCFFENYSEQKLKRDLEAQGFNVQFQVGKLKVVS